MIKFSKYRIIYLIISSIVIVPGVISLFIFGLKPSIDFTGGALLEYQFEKNTDLKVIQDIAIENKIEIFSSQNSKNNSVIIRLAPISQEQASNLKTKIEEKTSQKIEQLRFETIGPTLGKELIRKTVIAILISILATLLYVAWSFKNFTYGLAAVLALVHDQIVLNGCFSLFGHFFGIEVDSLFVTAVLTTTSFSVHDTIVVFHRIREIKKIHPRLNLLEASDLALSETMIRSVNNSLTIIFMLSALSLLGGESIRWFAIALLIGTITGTYSSPFVATPLVLFLDKLKNRKKIIKPSF